MLPEKMSQKSESEFNDLSHQDDQDYQDSVSLYNEELDDEYKSIYEQEEPTDAILE